MCKGFAYIKHNTCGLFNNIYYQTFEINTEAIPYDIYEMDLKCKFG